MKKVLCIEIGELFIKTCAVGVHDSGRMQILANSCCATPKRCCTDGIPLIKDALLETLNAEIEFIGDDIEDVYFSVSSSELDHATIQMYRSDYIEEEFAKRIYRSHNIPEDRYKIKLFISDEWTTLEGERMISIDMFVINRYLIQQYEKLSFDLGKNMIGMVEPWYAMTAIYKHYFKYTNSVLITIADNTVSFQLYNRTHVIDSFKYCDRTIQDVFDVISTSSLISHDMDSVDVFHLLKDNCLLGRSGGAREEALIKQSVNELMDMFFRKLENHLVALIKKNDFTFNNCYIIGLGPDMAGFNSMAQQYFGFPITSLFFQKAALEYNPKIDFKVSNIICACAALQKSSLIDPPPTLSKMVNRMVDFFQIISA